MKKFFTLAVAAIMFGTAANAQIGESKAKKIETTYTTTSTTKTVAVAENPNYNRIYIGYAPTKMKASYAGYSDSYTQHGFDLGWTGGYNVTKGHRLPLYVEAGVAMNLTAKDDVLLNFEIPFGITYRYNIPNTPIHLAPYFGFHLKVNALWIDDDSDSYFDYDGTHRAQFGMQLGANFDIKHFYVGIGWENDFNSIWTVDMGRDDMKFKTSGVRVRMGVTF